MFGEKTGYEDEAFVITSGYLFLGLMMMLVGAPVVGAFFLALSGVAVVVYLVHRLTK